jgi:DNA-binding NarL/FixJ family response regulator
VKVIVADDSVLLRRAVTEILVADGHEVRAVSDAAALLGAVAEDQPEMCVIDIRMPPTHTVEGLDAARTIRRDYPNTGVLILSQYVEPDYVSELLRDSPGRVGYLLKDSLLSTDELASAVHRVANGDVVVDPELIRGLLSRHRRGNPLDVLSPRERDVLQLMAEGRTDKSIAGILMISVKTVEKSVGLIFTKLAIPSDLSSNRRVQAVLVWLRS